eukprot:Amastigsp_a183185_25.p3 type:complete len:155 gc:universal Amastigsp_a183185_25:510-974(+)
MPLSISTLRTDFSITTLRPAQVAHRSAGLMNSPVPEHSRHCICICWTMPGPICRSWIRTPCPLHAAHRDTPAPPLPSQVPHSALRLTAIFFVRPLYRSSSLTTIGCTISSVRGGPRRRALPPPPNIPPPNMEKMSSNPVSCMPPSCMPSSPCRS